MTVRNPENAGKTHVSGSNERDLLLRHRDGDTGAFRRLVENYRRPVFSYLVRCGVAEADRDDLFQEVFIRVHAATDAYDESRPLHPWLFTVVANTVRTYHRKRKVRELVFAEGDDQEPHAPHPDAERRAIAEQTANWLEGAMRTLPLAQREVLILTCVESLSQKNVAQILGFPLNTVKTHLRRARLALARRLAKRNAPPSGEVPS